MPRKTPSDAAAAGDLGDGRLIRVRLPLTGNADAHIKSSIQRAVSQLTSCRAVTTLRRRPSPAGADSRAGARRAGRLRRRNRFHARAVARRLSHEPGAGGGQDVAYIPRTIKGHGVLVALACEEIVMHPEAEIGEAGIDEDASRPIEPSIVSLYQQIAAARAHRAEGDRAGHARPRAGSAQSGDRRGDRVRACATSSTTLKQNHTIVSPPEMIVPAGSMGSSPAARAANMAL